MTFPIFDSRTASDYFADAVELARRYCPQWELPQGDALTADAIAQDPGLALLKLFSLLGQDLANVVNGVPGQRQLSLYRFLDLSLRSAACASAPLRFSLAPQHAPVFLPKGASVVDPATRRIRFETDRDLQVLPATLRTVLTVAPRRDRYLDIQALWADALPAPAFPGRALSDASRAFGHAFLLGDAALFKPGAAAGVMTLTLRGRRLDADYFKCWYDAAMKPLRVTVSASHDGSVCTVEFVDMPAAPAQPVAPLHASLCAGAGQPLEMADPSLAACPSTSLYWLICKPADGADVVPALSGFLPRIDSVWCDFGTLSALPTQAVASGVPVDVNNGAYALGQAPVCDGTFCIRCDAAFARPGVSIKLTFDLRAVSNDGNAQLEWQYWNGAAWTPLAADGDPFLFTDGTRSLTAGGTVTVSFVCPTIVQTTVGGSTGSWIRAVLRAGDYGDAQSGFHPPFVRALSIEYASGGAPAALWAHNAFALDALKATPYEPYRPLAEEGASLYFSFDAASLVAYGLGQTLTLFFDIEPSEEQLGESDAGAWQWFDGASKTWRALDLDLPDTGLARSTSISFIVPQQLQASSLFSKTACWFRILCPSRDYPLRLRGIYPNTVTASNRTTYRDTVIGSSNGQPRQRFLLIQASALQSDADQVLLAVAADPQYAVELQVIEPVLADSGTIGVNQVVQTAPYPWTRVDSFVGTGPHDRVFVVDILARSIVFGDGMHGKIPPPGSNNVIASCYAMTRGADGNVPAGALATIYPSVSGIVGVTNPLPARGGAQADRVEDLIGSAAPRVRANDRVVSAGDVEALARLANAGICRVRAIEHTAVSRPGSIGLANPRPAMPPGSSGRPPPGADEFLHELELVVLAKSDDPEPLTPMWMLDQVLSYVRARSLPALAARTTARRPSFKRIDVAVLLETTAPKAQWAALRTTLAARLTQFLHPTQGGSAADGWPIGAALRYFSIHRFLLGADPAVAAVRALTVCGQTRDVPLQLDEAPSAGTIDIRLAEATPS
jgi:hypothetical protein